jgi:hypothetical protein
MPIICLYFAFREVERRSKSLLRRNRVLIRKRMRLDRGGISGVGGLVSLNWSVMVMMMMMMRFLAGA